MIVRGQRRRGALSLRRGIILNLVDPTTEAGDVLILRWIGASARRRAKLKQPEPIFPPDRDNVTILTWKDTFGRRTTAPGETVPSRVVVPFKPQALALNP